MNAAEKPDDNIEAPPRPSTSPRNLADLFDDLRTAATGEVTDRIGQLVRLRIALESYELAVRSEIEGRLAARLAETLGLAPRRPAPSASSTLAHAELHAELRAALASLGAVEIEADAPPSSRELEDQESGILAKDRPSEPTSEPVPPSGRARPLTPDELRAQLLALAGAPRPSPAPSPQELRARERQALAALLDSVGEPPVLESGEEVVRGEVDLLSRVTDPAEQTRWNALGQDVVTHWLAMLVARGRALRDAVDPRSLSYKIFRDSINRLPTYASTRPTGFINGMTPKHAPQHGTWRDDAVFHMKELRRVAHPSEATPSQPVPVPPKARESRPEREERGPIDWPCRQAVASMTVLLFGGTPREEARANVERTLGIGDLSWPESDKPRTLDAIVERIRAGKVGAVLVLTSYVSHKENHRLVEAAKASNTPYALVRGGYGVEAVRRSLEEALSD